MLAIRGTRAGRTLDAGPERRMNYPIWDLPASGLLIAFVAILHVFVSHFAVGGGLFLVLLERRARRDGRRRAARLRASATAASSSS